MTIITISIMAPQPGLQPQPFRFVQPIESPQSHRCFPTTRMYPPSPCIRYANIHNYYSPCAYCSLDKGVACVKHIQLPTYTCAGYMC